MSDQFNFDGYNYDPNDAAQWDESGGVRLPFPAPVMWWRNGKNSDQKAGGVAYLGGWAIMAEEIEATKVAPPAGWPLLEWYPEDGDPYQVYAGQNIGIAPIAKRIKWVQSQTPDPNTGKPKYYSRVQILSLLGQYDRDLKQFLGLGPWVISAKSNSSQEVINALKAFEDKTRTFRAEKANGMPANFFYAPIGTWGKTPVTKEVGGKAGFTKKITPAMLQETDYSQVGVMQALYVGKQGIEDIKQYRSLVDEWMKAPGWNVKGKRNNDQDGQGDQAPFDAGPGPGTPEDEFPF